MEEEDGIEDGDLRKEQEGDVIMIRLVIADMFFFQAEGGIRVPLWSRGLGNGYKRQGQGGVSTGL